MCVLRVCVIYLQPNVRLDASCSRRHWFVDDRLGGLFRLAAGSWPTEFDRIHLMLEINKHLRGRVKRV